ncbi:CaiB/BaiF CoA transferase family protein [Comamonas composti]|uniref:CaiB/BaiF CoA transferase family protein n=1 Tax=Comamonas composti TaxID=408558 RepID=UPI0003FF636F|nr:CoA transferase [Comamonas composti]
MTAEQARPASASAAAGPLDGVRVLDLTTVFMGPSATQYLGDLGADVIKIEAPVGDSTRAIGPGGEQGLGPLFLGLNRNKRSVVLDLKTPQGVKALLHLAKSADVFATNVRPAAMRRLGLGYEQLSQVNPRLIYASMVGFSQRGPYAGKAAFDDMIQAATGLAAAVGQAGGTEPQYLPITIADRSVGMYAFGVICAALHARHRTGLGQSIDIPMFETMIPYVLGDHLYGHTFAPARGGFGYPRLMSPNRRPYKTKDGYVCCLIYTDRHWALFLEAVGKAGLLDTDPRFKNIRARTEAIDALYELVADELAQRTTAEWTQLLPESEIPIFPMHTLESLLEDEHLAETGFFRQTEHPVAGAILETAVPSEWSGTPPARSRPVPVLGEHTQQVLAEAGYDPAEIDNLVAALDKTRPAPKTK